MARYQLTLAYDGTDFSGSQRQAKSRTVQGELEKALRSLGWIGRSVLMAGRTDTGTHAIGQVSALDLDWGHSEADLVRALNSDLPTDMAVSAALRTANGFHPRFDARSRSYRYRLFCQPVRDPIRERFAWRVWPQIDGRILAETAAIFVGTHDFSAFGSPTTSSGTTVRTVMQADWTQAGTDEWHFDVEADAFLYRMVRRLVFVQTAVANGKLPARSVQEALSGPARSDKNARSGKLPSGLAPAHGLMLVKVTYPQEESIGE